MAKRRHEQTISLFPFLAVLVCTMGALILLLLVTTRRIRQKQQQVPSEFVVTRLNEPEAFPIEAEPDDSFGTLGDSLTARVELVFARCRQAAAEQALNVQRQENAAVLLQLQQQQLELQRLRQQFVTEQQQHDAASTAADAEFQRLAELSEQKRGLEQQLAGIRQSIDELSTELAAAESLAVAAEQLVARRHSALRMLRDLEQQQEIHPSHTGVAETVIEFSNSAGTARTPVVIDVSEAGFVFTATGIKVRQRDMAGVTATDNPLLSGVLAVHRQRTSESLTSRPYVLLLVRPSGTLAFYLAQRVLSESRVHFGYELVSNDQVVAAAQPADGETQAVRVAVLESLMRRDKRLEATSSIRRRIAALRDSQQDAGWRARGETGSQNGRHYHGEPFLESDLNTSDPHVHAGESDASTTDITAAGPNGGTDTPADTDSSVSQPVQVEDSYTLPEPPVEVWQSIPSIAEAHSHVEDALAKALAAREAEELAKPLIHTAPTRAARSETNGLSSQPPAAVVSSSDADAPGDASHSPAAADATGNEFWTAMQPLVSQPSRARPRQDWSSAAESGGKPLSRSQTLEGQAYRPTQMSPATTPSLTSSSGQNSVPAGPLGTYGSSAGFSRLTSCHQITIYLDPQHYTIPGQSPVALHGKPVSQIVHALANELFTISQRHPHPLAEVTWPAAKFVVSPGAHTLYLQLAAELYDRQIPVASVVSMDAHVRDRTSGMMSLIGPPAQRTAAPVSHEKELP